VRTAVLAKIVMPLRQQTCTFPCCICGSCFVHGNQKYDCVQLKKLKSAALVAAKFNALMTNMKARAEKAVTQGVRGATAVHLTPLDRFQDDKNVPSSTRYAVPEDLMRDNYQVTVQKEDEMDAWDEELARVNASLTKEGDTPAGKASGSCDDIANQELQIADLLGCQQTTVCITDVVGASHK
jgi:hypothetical protein